MILSRDTLGSFAANIHVREQGRENYTYALLFRDFLVAHPDTARAYAAAKTKLASYFADDRTAYADVKDPICDLIMVHAHRWAKTTERR